MQDEELVGNRGLLDLVWWWWLGGNYIQVKSVG